jgi:hypothetical protein
VTLVKRLTGVISGITAPRVGDWRSTRRVTAGKIESVRQTEVEHSLVEVPLEIGRRTDR